MNQTIKLFGLALAIILLDQTTKLMTHFLMDFGIMGQIKLIGDWLKLHYTTNPGMAFGLRLDAVYGKALLTGFRMVAMVGIGYYLWKIIKEKQPIGLQVCVSLVLAGAVGNLIDSIFYGVFLNNAPPDSPTPWFHGQVVDMIYIDIWEGVLPNYIPFIGGQYYAFWPIFNVADASIFVGIITILLFQRRFFKEEKKAEVDTED